MCAVRRIFRCAGDLYDGETDRGAARASSHHAQSALRQRDSLRRADLGDDPLLRCICGRCEERLPQAVLTENNGVALHPRQGDGLRNLRFLDTHDRHSRWTHSRVALRAADGNVWRNSS